MRREQRQQVPKRAELPAYRSPEGQGLVPRRLAETVGRVQDGKRRPPQQHDPGAVPKQNLH
eukprot:2156550-Pyramimonas_sp.AAC.1